MAEKYSGSIEAGVSSRSHEIVVSDSIEHAVICPNGHEGTAIALAEAVEEAGETVERIRLKDNRELLGCKNIEVKADGPVPNKLHSLLTEWGYSTNDDHRTPNEYNAAFVYNDSGDQ